MLTQIYPQVHTSDKVVSAIAHIRQEWETATNGDNLVEKKGSIGLILADLALAIGLTPDEQLLALGLDLANQLHNVLTPLPGRSSKK